MGFTKIHHVSIMIQNLETSLKFYVETLGLIPIDRPEFPMRGAWLELAHGQQLHLVEDENATPLRLQHFSIQIQNMESALKHLRTHGITTPEVIKTPLGHNCFLRDPSGNGVELIETFSIEK